VKASYYAGEITHAYLEGIQYWDTECSIEDIQDILKHVDIYTHQDATGVCVTNTK